MNLKFFKTFKSNWYWKEFLLLLFCYVLIEPVFTWTLIQQSFPHNNYLKILSLVIYLFVLFKFKIFNQVEKFCIGLFTFLILKLVIESIVTYGAVFRYFEVYTFLYPVIFVIFIKWLAKELCADLLVFTVKFYLVAYVVFMILFGREFSLTVRLIEMVDYGPFSGDARIIHAQSLLLIIVPFLWYLNKYVTTQKLWYLLWFYVCFLIILLHQHRSVWSTTIVATAVYFFMAVRSNRKVIPAILKFLGISLL
ncbi:MAG TPA: hypothetical protein VM884_07075, partial [Flavisolibacter sp.]|nr:hypothetical protein [Flavisolibacter sp.]